MWDTFWGIFSALSQQLSAWALVVVTVAAAGASLGVAVLAHRNGTRATVIAEESARTAERAIQTQRELHDERISADYNARLDAALASFFRMIRNYYGPLDEWLNKADEVEMGGRTDPYTGQLLYPPEPPLEGVIAELEVTHLFAGPNDGRVIAAAVRALRSVERVYPNRRWELMLKLITIIRLWRTEQVSRDDAVRSLDGIVQQAAKLQRK